jgi:hypothetical protein
MEVVATPDLRDVCDADSRRRFAAALEGALNDRRSLDAASDSAKAKQLVAEVSLVGKTPFNNPLQVFYIGAALNTFEAGAIFDVLQWREGFTRLALIYTVAVSLPPLPLSNLRPALLVWSSDKTEMAAKLRERLASKGQDRWPTDQQQRVAADRRQLTGKRVAAQYRVSMRNALFDVTVRVPALWRNVTLAWTIPDDLWPQLDKALGKRSLWYLTGGTAEYRGLEFVVVRCE